MNVSKTVEVAKDIRLIEIDIRHRDGTKVNVVLCDLDLNYQGQIFSCYAFVIKQLLKQRISPVDLLEHARPPPWRCSYLSRHLHVNVGDIVLSNI